MTQSGEAKMAVRVKICCILDENEMRMAVGAGASAVGLVSWMPSGPGVIDEQSIGRIAPLVPPGVASFLLTAHQDAEEIIVQQRRCRPSVLQLCDRLSVEAHARLRSALPGIGLVQVVHVVDESAIDEALAVEGYVDAILLDSGRPDGATKELGGTGRCHNWEISGELCRRVSRPVWLAGGLNPENVAEAIRQVRPFGVDICNGVRVDGQLDAGKLGRFFEGVASVS